MIKNLIAGLPELGRIKAGKKGKEAVSKNGKKFRLPEKLDHFIITTMAKDENGDPIQDTELMDALKKSDAARVDANGNLTGIPIRLLYNTIDLNFPTRYACYVGGKCVCSGDGEIAHTRDGRETKCPCNKQDFQYQGRDKCKINGKLYCVIDGTTAVGACHVLRTTSFNTVQSILGGLAFIQAAAGGILAFLPLQLVLTPKTTVIPTTGAATTVYVSSIVYNGNIQELRQTALSMAKDKAQYLIEMDKTEESARQLMLSAVESEQEQLEVQEEFYPEAIVENKSKSKPKPEAEKAKAEIPSTEISEKSESKPKAKSKTKSIEKSIKKKQDMPNTPDINTDPPVINPITDAQKRKIIKLKKAAGITDKKIWKNLVAEVVPSVTTAVDMTTEEADKFIEMLRKKYDDVPF